ncbi:helix-turn-helix transcriptional regulator [Pedobacter gandavensis]|uniref:helix-turn-helix domain-containing protein n=1 Tax=Pedobacter gandavensis TaxID=2679963 RepID=UPI00292EA1B5|nr:helix-turn-helix transcriptional regulator [Pedobacter gandavensis]
MQEILSKKDIGERIKDLRAKNGHSQLLIAEVLQLSRSNYSQIELGNQYPSFHTLHKLARYYGKTYHWLIHGIEEEQKGESISNANQLIEELERSLKQFSATVDKLAEELDMLKEKALK